MWWLLGLTVVVAVAARGVPLRVGSEPVRVGDSAEPTQGKSDIVIKDYFGGKHGPWSCEKASKQPMPDVGKLVPQKVIAAAGPIGLAIVAMAQTVKQIFDAIGPKQVCTVRGGRYVPIVVYSRSPTRELWVTIEAMYGGAPPGLWEFRASRTDTGPVPLFERLADDDTPRKRYLMNGGEPPSDLWPHINIGVWQSWVTPELEEPLVDVVRSGDELTVYVWLPPRAPRSHTGLFGAYKIDFPVTWRVSWALG